MGVWQHTLQHPPTASTHRIPPEQPPQGEPPAPGGCERIADPHRASPPGTTRLLLHSKTRRLDLQAKPGKAERLYQRQLHPREQRKDSGSCPQQPQSRGQPSGCCCCGGAGPGLCPFILGGLNRRRCPRARDAPRRTLSPGPSSAPSVGCHPGGGVTEKPPSAGQCWRGRRGLWGQTPAVIFPWWQRRGRVEISFSSKHTEAAPRACAARDTALAPALIRSYFPLICAEPDICAAEHGTW